MTHSSVIRVVLAITSLAVPTAFAAKAATPSVKSGGVSTAPITIEVFSDYACPACKILYEGTLRALRDDYVAQGKILLIHRDFPLPNHQYSKEAARYANAAHRVGKYDQVAAALFAKQQSWSTTGRLEEVVAGALSVSDMNRLRALLKDPQLNTEIENEIRMGRRVNITQTPTMVITHRLRQYPIAGNINYSILRRFLDDLLAQ